MPNYNIYEDVFDAFMEGRWHPTTECNRNDDGDWTVTVKDNHGRQVQYTDSNQAEAHNRAMDLVRAAITEGRFLP